MMLGWLTVDRNIFRRVVGNILPTAFFAGQDIPEFHDY